MNEAALAAQKMPTRKFDRQTSPEVKNTYIHTYITCIHIYIYIQTDRQKDRQTGRQTDRQTKM